MGVGLRCLAIAFERADLEMSVPGAPHLDLTKVEQQVLPGPPEPRRRRRSPQSPRRDP